MTEQDLIYVDPMYRYIVFKQFKACDIREIHSLEANCLSAHEEAWLQTKASEYDDNAPVFSIMKICRDHQWKLQPNRRFPTPTTTVTIEEVTESLMVGILSDRGLIRGGSGGDIVAIDYSADRPVTVKFGEDGEGFFVFLDLAFLRTDEERRV